MAAFSPLDFLWGGGAAPLACERRLGVSRCACARVRADDFLEWFPGLKRHQVGGVLEHAAVCRPMGRQGRRSRQPTIRLRISDKSAEAGLACESIRMYTVNT